ncbi:hypothetical protein DFH28DRAFT_932491 [Melampsora americana]|nr:hypothetical protein DFH28DRAFT_932491 [Melampsora americana]
MSMRRVKDLSGIGWWDKIGKKNKDAVQFQRKVYDFFNEIDTLLHLSKSTGALQTGTSSTVHVKGKESKGLKKQNTWNQIYISIILAHYSLPTMESTLEPNPADSTVTPTSLTNQFLKSNSILPMKGLKSSMTNNFIGIDNIDSESEEPSGSNKPMNIKPNKKNNWFVRSSQGLWQMQLLWLQRNHWSRPKRCSIGTK